VLELHTKRHVYKKEIILMTQHNERISVRLTSEEEKALKDLKEILSKEKGLTISQSDVVRYAIQQLKKNTK